MPASKKQKSANQKNALSSTGPRTSAGKSKVAKNAVKHGLRSRHIVIDGESQSEFDDFREALLGDLDPVSPLEQHLAERIIASFWRLYRVRRIEVELLNNISVPDAQQPGNRLPFSVKITKTYANAPDQFVETPVYEKPVLEPNADKPQTQTLGQAVRTDLAGSNILSKFHRYEAHIDRTLYRALHELQRLQANRRGQAVSVPHVLDVDVNLKAES